MNYIKSMRYQIHLITKELSATACTVYCGITHELAREWNSNREDKYESNAFEELLIRFEEPNPMNRWDQPLFTLIPKHEDAGEIIGHQVLDALLNRKTLKPNFCTVVVKKITS